MARTGRRPNAARVWIIEQRLKIHQYGLLPAAKKDMRAITCRWEQRQQHRSSILAKKSSYVDRIGRMLTCSVPRSIAWIYQLTLTYRAERRGTEH